MAEKAVKPCLLVMTKHQPHIWGDSDQFSCKGSPLAFWGSPTLNNDRDSQPDLLLKMEAGDDTLQHIRVVLHEFWSQFLAAYKEYGPRAADELGLAGQWGDLHRKVKKLKAPLWEGNEERLTRETPRQVLFDIIGHALLAIDMIDREFKGGREG